jgi:hypothetical protein
MSLDGMKRENLARRGRKREWEVRVCVWDVWLCRAVYFALRTSPATGVEVFVPFFEKSNV